MYLENPGVRTFMRVVLTASIVSVLLSFLWHILLFITLVCAALVVLMIIWED